MSEKEGGDAPQNAQDLTVFVQSLLEQMVRASLLTLPLLQKKKNNATCSASSASSFHYRFVMEYSLILLFFF